MAEKAPPSTAAGVGATADASRGVPYYEKLRRDLRETLQKKRMLDKSLVGRSFVLSVALLTRTTLGVS